jgi:DNA-binding SARP family transcriptional activator/TolB-like protein
MFELTTLGVLDLRRADGTAVSAVLQQPKRTALLVYLAMSPTGAFQRRDTLLALFWPDSSQASARHSLSQAVYKLRQALGSDAILTRGDEEVSLTPGVVRCDVASFLSAANEGRHADALELYVADFLTGLHLDEAGEFDRWVERERSALRHVATRAAWAVAREQMRRGAVAEAERTARRALDLGPAEEASARAFLHELVGAGEASAALLFYEHVRRVLAREFELEPSEEMQALMESARQRMRGNLQNKLEPLESSSPVVSTVNSLPDRPRPARRTMRFSLAVGLLAVGGLAAAKLASRYSVEPAAHVASVVVLPLDNLTGDPRQDYFVDGMYNALIGELAQFSALRVISRGSAIPYAGARSSVADIARELKVDAIVKGGVMRSGDTVSVLVHLVGTRPERELWAASYKRNLADILSLHDEVARAIASEVEGKLSPREHRQASHARLVNPAAYDAWLQGSYHARRRSGADLDACFRFARQAAATDPNYAPAYQLLAECYNVATFVNTSPPGEMFEESKRAARRALALDETLAPAHAALGYAKGHYDWDWQGAEQSYRRALQLDPALESAEEDLAWLLSWLGRYDDALLHARKAEQLNPFSPQAVLRVAMILHFARRHDEAIAKARQAIVLDSAFMFGYDRLHWAYFGKGLHAPAVAAAERAVALSGPRDVRRKAFLAHAYAMNGRKSEARALLQQLLDLRGEAYVPPTAIAIVYVGLGDKQSALTWLERGYDGRDGGMVLLKAFPVWDPLRNDPRYTTLLAKMKFPE